MTQSKVAGDPTVSSHEEAIDVLGVARAIGYPSILWGDVGIGKSTLVERFGRRLGVPVVTVIASQSDPTDFGGLPVQSVAAVVSADGSDREVPTVDYALPDWAALAFEHQSLIVFLDEFSNASPAVQAAALDVVLSRRLGRVRLPSTVQFVAAANPPELAANGFDLSAPTANRFMHVHLGVPSVSSWTEALLDGWGLDPMPSEERPAAALVAAFLRSRPDLLHDRPETAGAAGLAWPSPRTWAQVVKALTATGAGVDRTAKLVVESLLGPNAALELLHWMRHVDLPDPAAVLADPTGLELTPERPDRAYAILLSVVVHVRDRIDEQPELWTRALALLSVCAEVVPDIAAHAARSLPERPDEAPLPSNLSAFLDVLTAAGLTLR